MEGSNLSHGDGESKVNGKGAEASGSGAKEPRRQRRVATPSKMSEAVPDTLRKEPAGSVKVPAGTGTALGEIPNVAYLLSKSKNKDLEVKALHRLLFNVIGKEVFRKKYIKEFRGLAPDYPVKRLRDRLVKLPVATLRGIAQLLDLPYKGSKESLSEILCQFLPKPQINPDRGDLRTEERKSNAKRRKDASDAERAKKQKKKVGNGEKKEDERISMGRPTQLPKKPPKTDEEISRKVREIMSEYSAGNISRSKTKILMEREWGCNLDDRMELIRYCVSQNVDKAAVAEHN